MPNVFVGHPFAGRFAVKKFRSIFRGLPFNVIYGNTDLQTRHLLTIMKSNIAKSDFSIFDLSNWNPNVALELGLAEGLKKKAAKNYYILLNTRRSSEVPSDIRGIQRLEYTSYDFKPEVGLGDQLMSYVLAKEYWVKRIWKAIPDAEKGPKKRIMALRILAHVRDHEKLTPDNVRSIAKGTRLREADRSHVLDALNDLGLLKRSKRGNTYVARRDLYKK
jgi:DNA-binding transcriptional ArsR family regulator